MRTYTDTPIYDQAYEAALGMAVDIDDMGQLITLENMNVNTEPPCFPFHTPDPIPF